MRVGADEIEAGADAYLTLARMPGDPAELRAGYLRSAAAMDEVGRDHGLLVHAAAATADGLLIVNLWPSPAGSETAARDPRRTAALRGAPVDPAAIRREHHEVLRYVRFD